MNITARAAAGHMAFRMGNKDKKRMKSRKFPQGVAARLDVPYLPDTDRGHLLDIYYPKYTHEKLPLILNIHGGGFVYGCKELNREFNMNMAAQGYTVIGVNYRLIPKVVLREQIQDILDALQWVAGHDDQYPYDLNHVYITGDSEGAFLGLYAGAVSGSPKLQKIFKTDGVPFKIRAFGFISGAFNTCKKERFGKIQTLLYKNREKKEKYYPYLKNPCGILKNYKMPPCYLVSDDEDRAEDYSKEFVRLLSKYGYIYQFHSWKPMDGRELEDAFCVKHPAWEESKSAIQEMLSFFEQSKSFNLEEMIGEE